MTEVFGLFDAADPEAPDRVYTSEAFARLFRTIMRDGIVHNDGDELAVSPTVPAAMSVNVGTGMALVQGRYYINDADLTLSVEAADPSYPRIDRVVVRADLVGRTVYAVVKKGTAAASPVAPPLTRTTETWELSLAQVRVEAGATSIVAAKITDERGNASLCGVAAPTYVPSSQLEVVGAVDMQGKALTGLPAPSGSTDAARKGYVDAEISGAISGFGISDINIDGPKNWQGQDIMNVGSLGAASIQTTTYTLVADPYAPCCYRNNSFVPAEKTASPVPADRSGSVYVSYDVVGSSGNPATVWLTLNGVEVPGSRHTSESGAFDQIVTVAPGDTIRLRASGSGGNTPYNSLFEIRAYMFLRYSAQHNW